MCKSGWETLGRVSQSSSGRICLNLTTPEMRHLKDKKRELSPTSANQTAIVKKACYLFSSRLSLIYMGWLMGLEPTTTGITILDSTN
jgi:hypothetical protein